MNIQDMLSLINKNTDPRALTNALLSRNPRLQPLFNQMKQSGMSEKDFVLAYCRQNNINVEPIVQMFKNKGINL